MNKLDVIEAALLASIPRDPGKDQERHYDALEYMLELKAIKPIAYSFRNANGYLDLSYFYTVSQHFNPTKLYDLKHLYDPIGSNT